MILNFKNKTYTLRDGSEYRNYCDDAGGKYPIHGAFKDDEGVWIQIANTLDGRFYSNGVKHNYDLIEVKKTHTVTFWVNCYLDGGNSLWMSKTLADRAAKENRISCFEVTRTFTEGEGLEDRK